MDTSGQIHQVPPELYDALMHGKKEAEEKFKKEHGNGYLLGGDGEPNSDCRKCKGTGSVRRGLSSKRRKPCPKCMIIAKEIR